LESITLSVKVENIAAYKAYIKNGFRCIVQNGENIIMQLFFEKII